MKADKLTARWSKREKDIVYHHPSKVDGHLLHTVMCGDRWRHDGILSPSFVKELEARGYDITTLRFEVTRKPKPEAEEPAEVSA